MAGLRQRRKLNSVWKEILALLDKWIERLAIALGVRSYVAFEVGEKNRKTRDEQFVKNQKRLDQIKSEDIDAVRARAESRRLRQRRKS